VTEAKGQGGVPTVADVWAEAMRVAEETSEDDGDEPDADQARGGRPTNPYHCGQ
jgi:hypothetical protein